MATLDILTARTPPALHKINVPLDRNELEERLLYGLQDFTKWLEEDLPKLSPGRLKAAETPKEQIDYRLYQWIVGKDITYTRMFNDLTPMQDEVWELKTADIRIFGWMYRPLIFIAVFGDYADLYKGPHAKKSYPDSRNKVVRARNALDLDEPKFARGTFDELVCI